MSIAGARWAALGLVAAAAIAAWEALKLDSWGFDGPGAGFFPQIVAFVALGLALAVLARPGTPAADEDGEDAGPAEPPAAAERRAFMIYAGGLLFLALGARYLGFTITALVLCTVLARFAEGRSWPVALGFAATVTLVGLVCFGWLLGVNLPEGPVDRAFYSLVR